MEAVANSVDDALIDSLSFKLSNSASYITDRNQSHFGRPEAISTKQIPARKSFVFISQMTTGWTLAQFA